MKIQSKEYKRGGVLTKILGALATALLFIACTPELPWVLDPLGVTRDGDSGGGGGSGSGGGSSGGGSGDEDTLAAGTLTDGALTTERASNNLTTATTAGTITLSKNGGTAETKASIAAALSAIPQSGSDSYVITLAPGKYSENGLTIKTSNNVTIKGTGSAPYGMDVLIYGQGTNMSTESTRSTLSFQGAGHFALENLTIQNSYGTTGGTAQAETLGVGGTPLSGTIAAYNCAFLSGQDTICTEGKAWFYKCYVEGDVDFLWIESYSSKVALYEECVLRAISSRTTKAYFTAPRLAVSNTVGKGLVIWNSTLEAEDGLQNVYLGRNPWDKETDEKKGTNYFGNYYENVAIVGTKYYGKALNDAIWSGSGANGTSDQRFVGFKTDEHFAASSNGVGAIIGSDIVEPEYSDRNAILNRVYNISAGEFENDSASDVWDISALENEFGSGSSGALPTTAFDATKAKVVWDLASAWTGDDGTTSSYEGKSGKVVGTIEGYDGSDYTVKMHVNGTNGKFNFSSTRTQMNANTVITVPVTDGAIVSVTTQSGTVLIEGSETNTYTHSGSATGIVIYCTATKYLTEISVSKLNLTALSADLLGATATGEVQAIVLGDSEKSIMEGNEYSLTATTYASYGATAGATTWTSSATGVATVDSSGKVKAVASSGTATITATNNGKSATCTITATPKTEVSKYTFEFRSISSSSVTASEDSSVELTWQNWSTGNNYGIFSSQQNATITIPVFASCKIYYYQSYNNNSTEANTDSVTIGNETKYYDVKTTCNYSGDAALESHKLEFTYSGSAGTTTATINNKNLYVAKIVVEKVD